MTRNKIPKLIITFPTTTAAMAMDATCPPTLGRLIPIPGEVRAGCGLAWCANPESKADLLHIIEENKITYEGFHMILLY